MRDAARAAVVAAESMTDENYLKHISRRHIRLIITREEHDDNHIFHQSDYNHTHEEP